MKSIISLAAALLGATTMPVGAQALPGKNLTATVRPRSVSIAGDTTVIQYSIVNGGASAERLQAFAVSLAGSFVSMTNPDTSWIVSNAYRLRPVVYWARIPGFAPNDSTPTLQLKAVGLPGIAQAWYAGDSTIHVDDAGTVPDYDPLDDLSNSTQTVGIDVAPTTLSGLISRLRTLTDSACTLAWIRSGSLCSSLDAHLTGSPTIQVNGFSSTLDSARAGGSAVTDA